MTKKLEELFELPVDETEINSQVFENTQVSFATQDTYDTLQKIESALPQVRGLEASDN